VNVGGGGCSWPSRGTQTCFAVSRYISGTAGRAQSDLQVKSGGLQTRQFACYRCCRGRRRSAAWRHGIRAGDAAPCGPTSRTWQRLQQCSGLPLSRFGSKRTAATDVFGEQSDPSLTRKPQTLDNQMIAACMHKISCRCRDFDAAVLNVVAPDAQRADATHGPSCCLTRSSLELRVELGGLVFEQPRNKWFDTSWCIRNFIRLKKGAVLGGGPLIKSLSINLRSTRGDCSGV